MLPWKRNAAAAGGTASKTPSVIATGLLVKGELQSSGEIRVDGAVEGNLAAPAVAIGRAGSIKGNVVADWAVIEGAVTGQIKAKSVILARTARVTGDVIHATLKVEAGATVDGRYRPLDPGAGFVADLGGAGAASRPVGETEAEPKPANAALPLAMLRGRALVILGGGAALLALVAFAYPPVPKLPLASSDVPRAEPVAAEVAVNAVESDQAAAEAPAAVEKLPSIEVKPRPSVAMKPLREVKPPRAVAARETRRRAPTLAAGRDESTPEIERPRPAEADAAAPNPAPVIATYTRLDTN